MVRAILKRENLYFLDPPSLRAATAIRVFRHVVYVATGEWNTGRDLKLMAKV